ncbi:MAG: helix-turn-helix domain-containing protein [Candidatus Woesearchaeota archaeon]
MWVVRLQIHDERDWLSILTKKYHVTVLGYFLSRYKKEHKIYINGAGLISGEEKNKKLFITHLKKSKHINKFEIKNDFYVMQITRAYTQEEDTLVNPEFIYPKPITILPDGKEIWEFASWDRAALEKTIRKAEQQYDVKILSIKEQKLNRIAIFNITPNLTDKQKQAITIAMEHGYYAWPKKTDMRKLAKIMKISLATYQAHLKKAEAKLIPYSL